MRSISISLYDLLVRIERVGFNPVSVHWSRIQASKSGDMQAFTVARINVQFLRLTKQIDQVAWSVRAL